MCVIYTTVVCHVAVSPFAVYIMSSYQRTIYVGVTNNLLRRAHEHRTGALPGFTKDDAINRLVYFETTPDVSAARARRQSRDWQDLALEWGV